MAGGGLGHVLRILLVEDDARIAGILKRGLQEEGHPPESCTSGVEAIEQAISTAYDVIILDWGLPGVDGISMLQNWRSRGLRTPVLMLIAR
jgi:two-component system OmpR family response regulator